MLNRQAESVLSSVPIMEGHSRRSLAVNFRQASGAVGRRDYATHWLHRYPAKMFHRIPQTIISRLPIEPKIRILDPFCGSGTVLVEAIRHGHDAVGIDVNPLARLISNVKTTPLDSEELFEKLTNILIEGRRNQKAPRPSEALDFWFKPKVRTSLEALRSAIESVSDVKQRDFFLVSLSSIVRKASLADPSIPPPVRLSEHRAARANARYRKDLAFAQSLDSSGTFTLFQEAVCANVRRITDLKDVVTLGQATILPIENEAARTGLQDTSVDLVITSPPYCGAQKYIRSVRLELLILGFGEADIALADKRTLGTERTSSATSLPTTLDVPLCRALYRNIKRENPSRARIFLAYVTYLRDFANELDRVLKIGAEAFVTFGTDHVAGYRVDCAKIFARAAVDLGFKHVSTLVDSIPSRGMITNRHTSAGTITDERVVWIRK